MRPERYIGITGFMTRQEVDTVLEVLPEESPQLVMLGVLASSKTLHWEQNKWPKRYPKPDALGKIFPAYKQRYNLLNLIHFNTKTPEHLFDDMCLAQDLAGPNCHGFQLNIAWPDPKVIERYKKAALFHNKTVVLQCGGKALEQCHNDPVELVIRLHKYQGLIDYVLIDPSGGLGQEFNAPVAMDYFAGLDRLKDLGFGIAGGLHAGNIDRLVPLLAEYEDFSIDAEGKLRDAEDSLDIKAARDYLAAAYTLFNA